MSLLQLFIISVIQGITEWLPISSSGHVLLAADYFALDGRDEALINVMAHVGTLFAVLLYFWREIAHAAAGAPALIAAPLSRRPLSANSRLALNIITSTPIALIAIALYQVLLDDGVKDMMRSVWVVGATSIIFGLALWWADVKGGRDKTQADMRVRDAVMIGATQAVAALLPGTSRSGITMTAARALGYSRTEAARFSMLIGAPILAASGFYALLELTQAADGDGLVTLNDGLIVAGISFASGFLSIWALMALLQRISFLPFVIYRIIFGAILLLGAPYLGLA